MSENFPEQAITLAEKVAASWTPFPAYIVDIGLTAEYNWAVMEVGSFSFAGLYKCDLSEIVRSINQLLLKEFQ